jgi:hypothetical protein
LSRYNDDDRCWLHVDLDRTGVRRPAG